MNGIQLKLARELLGLSQVEAAEHIGKVNQRAWAYWEAGRSPVKPDVAQLLNQLLSRRRQILKQFITSQENEPAHKVVVVYYNTPEYCQSYLDWKFSQSLARTLAFDFGAVLVDFDKASFDEFCRGFGLEDTPASRSEWAVWQNSKGI